MGQHGWPAHCLPPAGPGQRGVSDSAWELQHECQWLRVHECQWLRVEAAAHSRAAAQLVRIECKPDAELQGFGSASICKSTYESVAGPGKVYHFRFRLSLQAKTPAFDYHGFTGLHGLHATE